MTNDEIKRVARTIARELMDSTEMRQMLREITLRIVVEQDAQHRAGACRTFLGACEARGIRCRLDQNGKLLMTNADRLGADLRAVLIVYRPEIVGHLERVRDLEEHAQRRYEAAKGFNTPQNGIAKH